MGNDLDDSQGKLQTIEISCDNEASCKSQQSMLTKTPDPSNALGDGMEKLSVRKKFTMKVVKAEQTEAMVNVFPSVVSPSLGHVAMSLGQCLQ